MGQTFHLDSKECREACPDSWGSAISLGVRIAWLVATTPTYINPALCVVVGVASTAGLALMIDVGIGMDPRAWAA